jgi:hypothetical protein
MYGRLQADLGTAGLLRRTAPSRVTLSKGQEELAFGMNTLLRSAFTQRFKVGPLYAAILRLVRPPLFPKLTAIEGIGERAGLFRLPL